MVMTGLSTTGFYLNQIVGRVSPAVSGITSVLTNPYFYAIILALLILSLTPGSND